MDTLLSIITLYNYDDTLFNDFEIPTGIDKELVINNIMLELGELELLYNDPNMMKFAIVAWSKKEVDRWTKLYDTTKLDYNPIENYNRVDDFTEIETRDLETGVQGESNTVDRNSGGDTIKQFKQGYDSEVQTQTDQETSELGTVKTVGTGTAQTGTDKGNIENVKSGSAKGNIGVTTTQQMIQQERNILDFNIYDYIVSQFKQRFCLLIY